MNTIADIAQELWEPAVQFHQEAGISYYDYLTELTWLLFLKVAAQLGHEATVHLIWETLLYKKGTQQFEYYKNMLSALAQANHPYLAGIFADAVTHLHDFEQFTQMMTAVEVIDTVPTAELGEIYENLLEQCAYDENTFIVPPRALVDTMVILLHPEGCERIYDPSAGTGSFLVGVDQYIKVTQADEHEHSSTLPRPVLQGIESNLIKYRLALMNCFLHRIDYSDNLPVRWDKSVSDFEKSPVDVVLSSLLFPDNHAISATLLQHIYQILSASGRAAVVVPDEILQSEVTQPIRRELLEKCHLHTILRLPVGIFYPQHALAHVLFFQCAHGNTQRVWYYDARSQSPQFGSYLQLSREHLMPFEQVYGDDPHDRPSHQMQTARWHSVDRETLAAYQDRLDGCWLEESPALGAPNKTENVWEVIGATMTELESLSVILRDDDVDK